MSIVRRPRNPDLTKGLTGVPFKTLWRETQSTAGNSLTIHGWPASCWISTWGDIWCGSLQYQVGSAYPEQNGQERKLLSQAEMPTDLPKNISHILKLGDWHYTVVVQATEIWPHVLSQKSSWFMFWEGSFVLFDAYFEFKDLGLNILTSLSKPALTIRNGSRIAYPEMCSMLCYWYSMKQRDWAEWPWKLLGWTKE